ncbi:unnamed protein product [Citrullus colocynthis]|uniref:Uncharacterized protein n=1 Tax=Citrullus colocynthis TaxID=252529 RepID=A0ABP0Z8N6_9ROSI
MYRPLDTRTPAFFCPSSSISFSVTAARRARSETSGLATLPTAESSGCAGGHPRSLSALTPKYRGTEKSQKRGILVRNLIRDVSVFGSCVLYEKRITELLKVGKDKKAL